MAYPEAITLHQLNASIQSEIRNSFSHPIWVVAEINQLNVHSSGHCYLELIEKEPVNDRIIANIRATMWASTYHRLSAFFKTAAKQDLSAGIKVLIRVQVDFHEVFGISLNIRDIDPNYTLGDMARKRAEIIQKLEEAGVIDMNQGLALPRVPQKIAIISSPSAAGYEDFCNQLDRNQGGYVFYHTLFKASMQGQLTAPSIIQALDRIAAYADFFEVVVIIRGGGSKTDLSYFDDFDLAYYITQFPIPVLTGIGHERDESVADLVAHTSAKTPTAVAEFLIDLAEEFDSELDWLKEQISRDARKILSLKNNEIEQRIQSIQLNTKHYQHEKKHHLRHMARITESNSRTFLQNFRDPLHQMKSQLSRRTRVFLLHHSAHQKDVFSQVRFGIRRILSDQNHRLELYNRDIEHLNPVKILKRGYSITVYNGSPLKNTEQVKKGDRIITRLHKGNITSIID